MSRIALRSFLAGQWLALLLVWTLAAQASVDIIKSPHDPRAYRALVLDNGLQVVLVSDPTTDKAAASLDVNVGSGSDPEDRQGLAHFLEHMLFLGTEKYPDPAEYKTFISDHGGSDNAYTSFDHTNYFFDVDKEHLEPALDRFAQFFVAPKFTPRYVARERQIVHSEYRAKYRSDGRRVHHAQKKAMNPRHPYTTFSVGSNETLADREGSSIRDELIAFYRKHYSANIMTLAVLGREPLPVLEGWVRERFSAVPNNGARRLHIDAPLFLAEQLPARISIEPVKNRRSLSLTFPIPPVDEHHDSRPTFYLSHLLGHEGKGSLLSVLKKMGWADGLSAGLGLRHPDTATFEVSIKLTPEGLERSDEVVAHVFQYLELIRREGVARWMFEEQRRLGQIRFRYAEKIEPIAYVRSLANDLHDFPPRELLRAHYVFDEFDPGLVAEYLDRLRPENVLVTLTTKGVETNARTHFYDVAYGIFPIEEATLASWRPREIHADLALPGPNPFIPEDLALAPPEEGGEVPTLAKSSPGFELWHRLDTEFGLPLANFYFSVRSPVANDTPEHAVLTELYVQLVNDQLNEFAYDADIAGLGYSLYKHIRGFTARISGYDDKQHILVREIVEALRNPNLPEDRFAIAKEDMVRHLRNAKKNAPYRRAMGEVRHLLVEPNWSEDQLLAVMEEVDVEALRRFVPELLAEVHVVALAHGNLRRAEALQAAAVLEKALVEPAKAVDVPSGRVVKLDAGDRYLRVVDNSQDDSAVVVYFQGDDKRIESRARAALLARIMGPPFFDALRTEKELGYIVFATTLTILETPGIGFVVQSPIADAATLQRHIQAFLVDFAGEVDVMDEDTFARHRAALLTNLLEADARLDERSNRYWTEIDRGHYEFDLRERLAAAVRATTLADLKTAYRSTLLGEERKRIVVQAPARGHGVAAGHDGDTPGDTVIGNARSFKQEKGFFSG